jgi:CBS domain-containing protein
VIRSGRRSGFKEDELRVSDLMHRGIVICPPHTPLGEAAAMLIRERVHAIFVADADGVPTGIVSDTDLLSGEWLSRDEERLDVMRSMTAGELKTEPPATIDIDAPLVEAARVLATEGISRLLVTEGGEPVGVLSVSDLVRSLAHASVGRGAVADVMSRAFVACLPDVPVPALARAMSERRSRSVVVLDRDGRAVGVVTGRDLLPFIGDAADTTAETLMHPPLTITPAATLAEAADAMLRHEVHRLVVMEDGSRVPLGIVSTWDVLAEMAEPGSVWQS